MDRSGPIWPPDETRASSGDDPPASEPWPADHRPGAAAGAWRPDSAWAGPPRRIGGTGPARRIAVVGGPAGRAVARMLADAYAARGDDRHAIVDAGPVVDSPMWHAAVTGADQFVVAVDAIGGGPAEALTMLDAIAGRGRGDDLRRTLTVVLLPRSRRGLSRGHEDIASIDRTFARRTALVLFAPHTTQPSASAEVAWRRIVSAADHLAADHRASDHQPAAHQSAAHEPGHHEPAGRIAAR